MRLYVILIISIFVFFGCNNRDVTPEGAMIFYTETNNSYEVSFNSGSYHPILYKSERPYCYEPKENFYTVQLPIGKYPITIKKGSIFKADTIELKEAFCQAYNVIF